MSFFVLLLQVLLPVFFFLGLLFYRDSQTEEKESFPFVILIFWLGMLMAFCSAIFQDYLALKFSFKGLAGTVIQVLFFTAFLEELSKFIVLLTGVWQDHEFNERGDGLFYGMIIGMGFSSLENVFYAMQGGQTVNFIRIFTAFPLHVLCAGVMGYYFDVAKFSSFTKSKKLQIFLEGLVWATFWHALYNFIILLPGFWKIGAVVLEVLLFFLVKRADSLLRKGEVENIVSWENFTNWFYNSYQEILLSILGVVWIFLLLMQGAIKFFEEDLINQNMGEGIIYLVLILAGLLFLFLVHFRGKREKER